MWAGHDIVPAVETAVSYKKCKNAVFVIRFVGLYHTAVYAPACGCRNIRKCVVFKLQMASKEVTGSKEHGLLVSHQMKYRDPDLFQLIDIGVLY